MRKIKKYRKRKGTKRQIEKLKAINKLQDDIAKYFFDPRFKKT